MLLQAALVEITLTASIEYAGERAPAGLALMNLQMLLQVASACEGLWAVAAFERLLARVNARVPDEVRHLAEGLPTALHRASIRPLSVMDPSMLLQRGELGKNLSAVTTNEALSIVMGPLMLL